MEKIKIDLEEGKSVYFASDMHLGSGGFLRTRAKEKLLLRWMDRIRPDCGALVLCGVTVPWDKGLAGHSDADVAVHALMDALLGAAGLGDIGGMFPDTDPATQGISSMALLRDVRTRLEAEGLGALNCDVTIVAQRPKLAPYIGQMRDNVAQALGLDRTSVNVKATTTEAMGYEGRGEGISAHAVALIGGKDPCSL